MTKRGISCIYVMILTEVGKVLPENIFTIFHALELRLPFVENEEYVSKGLLCQVLSPR